MYILINVEISESPVIVKKLTEEQITILKNEFSELLIIRIPDTDKEIIDEVQDTSIDVKSFDQALKYLGLELDFNNDDESSFEDTEDDFPEYPDDEIADMER